MSSHPVRKLVPVVCVMALLVAFAAAGSAGAIGAVNGDCMKVSGKVTMGPVSPGECASPLGMCGRGDVTGHLKGGVFFSATEYLMSADTAATGVVFVTGDAIFNTRCGTLVTKDAITRAISGNGEYAEVITILGGTGCHAGATGRLVAGGSATADGASGSYTGEVCFP
ncbi:MAG: hypothetical protein MUC34_07475 [Anaerolineae bacterium]|nr:hypothetical protein [Anaerolineae bacterium]